MKKITLFSISLLTICLTFNSCILNLKNLETNYSLKSSYKDDLTYHNTAIIVLAQDTGLVASEDAFTDIHKYKVWAVSCGIAGICNPIPLDCNVITSPKIEFKPSQSIDGFIDMELTKSIYSELFGREPNIVWTKKLSGILNLEKINLICKNNNIQYLYLIRYNEYKSLALVDSKTTGSTTDGYWRTTTIEVTTNTISGSIYMTSRALFDLKNNTKLLDKQRIGERFFIGQSALGYPSYCGTTQATSSNGGSYYFFSNVSKLPNSNVGNYINSIYVKENKESAYPVISKYLIKNDLDF